MLEHYINNDETDTININKTDVPLKIEDLNYSNINIEQIKGVIISALNDDIWYNGNYSQYKGFEEQETSIEIYRRCDRSLCNDDEILVLFDKPFEIYEGGRKSESKGYFMLGFAKTVSGKRGYENKVIQSCVRITKDEVKKEVMKDGDVFLAKSDIKFLSAI